MQVVSREAAEMRFQSFLRYQQTTGLLGKEQTSKAEQVSADRSRGKRWTDQDDDPAAAGGNSYY